MPAARPPTAGCRCGRHRVRHTPHGLDSADSTGARSGVERTAPQHTTIRANVSVCGSAFLEALRHSTVPFGSWEPSSVVDAGLADLLTLLTEQALGLSDKPCGVLDSEGLLDPLAEQLEALDREWFGTAASRTAAPGGRADGAGHRRWVAAGELLPGRRPATGRARRCIAPAGRDYGLRTGGRSVAGSASSRTHPLIGPLTSPASGQRASLGEAGG